MQNNRKNSFRDHDKTIKLCRKIYQQYVKKSGEKNKEKNERQMSAIKRALKSSQKCLKGSMRAQQRQNECSGVVIKSMKNSIQSKMSAKMIMSGKNMRKMYTIPWSAKYNLCTTI